jgi:hypothetical protein
MNQLYFVDEEFGVIIFERGHSFEETNSVILKRLFVRINRRASGY